MLDGGRRRPAASKRRAYSVRVWPAIGTGTGSDVMCTVRGAVDGGL